MRNVPDKICRENQNILCSTFSENRSVGEVLWKNVVELARRPITVQYGTCSWRAG
jgi:hypothetical protein